MYLIKRLLAGLGLVFIALIVLTIFLSLSFGREKVAVVRIEGVIIDPHELLMELQELGERDDVRAVVIRIDSPGGAVGPSQELHREIKRLGESKKVVASMGAVAASGGYYAAVATEKIVANPGTITGSIGVLVEFVNARALLDKIGIEGYVVKSGEFKDTGSPFRKIEEREVRMLEGVVNDVKGQFVRAVSEGRNLKVEDVEKIADGRILTGAQAKELGLVDELGDLRDAINIGAKMAGIEGKPRVIYPERRVFEIWQAFFRTILPFKFTEAGSLRIMYMAPDFLK